MPDAVLLPRFLQAIKKELGMTKDDKDSLLEHFREVLKGKTIPATVGEEDDTCAWQRRWWWW
jgi:hypothetical protein